MYVTRGDHDNTGLPFQSRDGKVNQRSRCGLASGGNSAEKKPLRDISGPAVSRLFNQPTAASFSTAQKLCHAVLEIIVLSTAHTAYTARRLLTCARCLVKMTNSEQQILADSSSYNSPL
jgi:hypothetical protein